ncbi:MAG: phenylalanine--tRNA ligase subunit alpha [Candidatus Omnitrophica bacterium]|nr:phenylalanine--tRNA ligase subunit alpha [Candidatus Omnitrophota bacterium]
MIDEKCAILRERFDRELALIQDLQALEQLRINFLGRKGALQELMRMIPSVAPEERPRLGQQANELKNSWTQALESKQVELMSQGVVAALGQKRVFDVTLPGHPPALGHQHLITQVVDEIVGIFERMGFAAVEGPEIEEPFYNFDALNIPADHPSRESFDTFFVKKSASDTGTEPDAYLLRSHTSPMQVRYMQKHKPPFRIVVPGRVYRPDAVDASHCFQFHQIEGLVVEPDVTFADLKGLLAFFARGFFGSSTRIRFRPHFFPFTEPSAEMDVGCIFCRGLGCRVCGQKGWLEVLGSGVVHPHVFKAAGYSGKTRGIAFGLGIERIAMLKHGIDDIRCFFENDLRFLHQF